MITQPNSHIEDRPTTPPEEREPYVHLPRRFAQTPNLALACLQLLVGYAWLLAGVDKLLLGVFPAQLGGLLRTAVGGGHLPGFFVALLQGLVVPNAVLFGYFIEWAETLAGLGLMTAGLLELLRPLAGRYLGETPAVVFLFGTRLMERLAPLAATGAGLLGLSYFLLDGAPTPWFVPSIAFGGAMNAVSLALTKKGCSLWMHTPLGSVDSVCCDAFSASHASSSGRCGPYTVSAAG